MEFTVDLSVLKIIHRRNLGLSTVAGNVFGFTDSQSLSRLAMFMEHMMILDASGFDFGNREKANEIFAILIHQIWGMGSIPKDIFTKPEGVANNHMLLELYAHLEDYKNGGGVNPEPIIN